ncbi:MAG: helix-turn-helix domain-containing protein [Clostridiaceae bacterium]
MYNVLVVDDEELICQSIVSMINRSGIGSINEVSYAKNSLDAEKLILSSVPDIVVTDICMPGRSGLELIKNTSCKSNTIKYIILSGYNDFEYAKSAIKLNVIDYLLKPVSIINLRESLETAVRLLDKEKLEQSLQEEHKHRIHREQKQVQLESMLNKLFQYQGTKENICKETIKVLKREIPLKYLCVSVIDISKALCPKVHDTLVQIQKINFESFCGSVDLFTYEIIDFKNNIVIIYNAASFEMYDTIIKHNHMLMDLLNKNGDAVFICGISEMSDDLYNIIDLHAHAIQTLPYKLIHDNLPVIEYIKVKDNENKYPVPFHQANEFIKDLENHKIDAILNFIDSTFNRNVLDKYSIDAVDRLYRGVVNIIWVILTENNLEDQIDTHMNIVSIQSFTDIRDVRLYLKELILKAIQLLKSNKPKRSQVEVAKEYIRVNIGKDINMTVVSNSVNMNYTYFSMQFKQETGMNFSEYLIAERMKEAQKLMSDPSNKIQDIAVKLGYGNPKNFTRAFKKFFGLSPSKYQIK